MSNYIPNVPKYSDAMKVMRQLGLNAKAFAKKLGLKEVTIKNWEVQAKRGAWMQPGEIADTIVGELMDLKRKSQFALA